MPSEQQASLTNGAVHVTGSRKPLPATMKQIQQGHPFDRLIHAGMGKATAGLSPVSLSMAIYDWLAHLAMYPSKRAELTHDAFKKALLLATYANRANNNPTDPTEIVIQPQTRDRRFVHEAWQQWPFNIYHQAFLLVEAWWRQATEDIRGVSRHHTDVVNFFMRQLVDIFSPSNLPWMNPIVLDKTLKKGGTNIVQGMQNYMEDLLMHLSEAPETSGREFQPGVDVAISPGKVVYRNHLIELIQYSPTTEHTYPEPILIVPAWIMKYYILDLSPNNSLVKYLVGKGHTVFIISWKNPDAGDRDTGFNDYMELGVLEAIEAIQAIVPDTKIHATGYCLGGTLLMVAASYLARIKSDIFKSITLLAAQVDFEEAGELLLFVDESQLAATEDAMWQQG